MNSENHKKCENFKEKVSLFDSFIDYSNGSWEQISPTEKRITFSCSKYETGQPKVVPIKCKIFKESPKLVNEKIHLCDTCGIRNCPTRVLIKDTVTHCSSYILKQPNNKKLCLGCEHSKDIDCTKRPITNIASFCERYIKKQPDIYVPDGVQFARGTSNCGMGLLFNNNKQEIYYLKSSKLFTITISSSRNNIIKPILIPCKREDIGLGEWGHCSDSSNPDFDNIGGYCLNVGDKLKCVELDDNGDEGDIVTESDDWEFWWKVLECRK